MKLKNVMTPEFHEKLRLHRNHARSTLGSLKDGVISAERAAMVIAGIPESLFSVPLDRCGYGVDHPYTVFAARLHRVGKILMGERWANIHFGSQ